MTITRKIFTSCVKIVNWSKFFIAVDPISSAIFFSTKIINAGLGAALVFYSGMLIDSIVAYAQGEAGSNPVSVIITMLVMGIALGICSHIGEMAIRKSSDKIDHKLGKRFLDTIHKSDFLLAQQEEYKNKNRMAERMMHSAGVWMVNRFAFMLMSATHIIAYASLIITVSDLRVALATILAGLLIMAPYTIIEMRLTKEGNDLYAALSSKTRITDMYKMLLISAYSAKEVRLFGLFGNLFSKWEGGFASNQGEYKKLSMKEESARDIFSMLVIVFIFLLFLLAFWVSPLSSPGQFTILLTAFSMILTSFKWFGQTMGYFYSAILDIERLEEFEDFAKPIDKPVPPQQGSGYAIELRNVYFGYNAEHDVLNDISLTINKGETIAIVGGNGSGKTTLAMLLVGLYNPRQGDLQINGKQPDLFSPDCDIVMVAQNYGYYSALPLIDNINFGKESDLLSHISKVDDSGRLTNNLDKLIGNAYEGIELSGGEWQRVALLRPLATNANIVIFDEPTAALDPISELKVFQQFMSLYENRTRIIISHRLGAIKGADRIVVMDEGRIIGLDSHENLLVTNAQYSAMYEAQASWYREGGVANG